MNTVFDCPNLASTWAWGFHKQFSQKKTMEEIETAQHNVPQSQLFCWLVSASPLPLAVVPAFGGCMWNRGSTFFFAGWTLCNIGLFEVHTGVVGPTMRFSC